MYLKFECFYELFVSLSLQSTNTRRRVLLVPFRTLNYHSVKAVREKAQIE